MLKYTIEDETLFWCIDLTDETQTYWLPVNVFKQLKSRLAHFSDFNIFLQKYMMVGEIRIFVQSSASSSGVYTEVFGG